MNWDAIRAEFPALELAPLSIATSRDAMKPLAPTS
jgi:hypothetical protein